MIAIAKVAGDEVGFLQLADLAAAGNVNTTTLKALTLEEWGRLLKKLPWLQPDGNLER